MKFIKKLTYNGLVDLIDKCSRSIFWVSPALTAEIAYALAEAAKKGRNINVVTDINPNRFKRFEGEFKAIEVLKAVPDLTLKAANDIGLGFFIMDDTGYAFFNPLRAYETDGERFNAFKLQKETAKSLKALFFNKPLESETNEPDIFTAQKKEAVQNALNIRELKDEELEETKNDLAKNPPPKIDFERTINVYRAHFQFVEAKFKGSNFHIKKVKLPRNALPIRDTRLKKSIESNLRLFRNIPQKSFFQPFFDLKEDWDILKASYITHIKSREKNVIGIKDKPEFEAGFLQIKKKVEEVKQALKVRLQEEIISTQTAIRDSLKSFFIANPTKDLEGLKGDSLEKGAEHQASNVISKINFPSADDLLSGLSLEKYYYDITWKDLNDEDVIKEFKEKKLIDEEQASELKSLSKAFEVQD